MGSQYFPPKGGGGGGGGSPYWGNPVANVGALPVTGLNGEIVETLDTGNLYRWIGGAWELYYQPLPDFVNQRVLYGDGSKIPAQHAELYYNSATNTLYLGAYSAASNGRLIVGGSTSGIGRIDGGGGILSVAGGGLDFETHTNAQDIRVRPAVATALTFKGTGEVQFDLLTASTVPYLDVNKRVVSSAITPTKLGYLADVTGLIQAAIDAKLPLAGGTMTGVLTLAADPVSGLQAATKQYVDAVAQGLNIKASVKVATTANITLSGTQTIDGISVTAGMRVLVKNQSAPAQNGLYLCAAGAWTRTTDMDTWAEVPAAFVFVEEGTAFGDCGFVCTANAGGTLGTTAIPWTQFSGAGTYSAGQGLTQTGTVFSITPLTSGRAVITDVSGNPTASGVTAAEVGYLAGTTSNIQLQLNLLMVANAIVSVAGNVSLTNKSLNLVDTTTARTLTLPNPALLGSGGYIEIKDKTGTADVNNITVARFGTEKIETVAASWVIDSPFSVTGFVTDGTDWWIV